MALNPPSEIKSPVKKSFDSKWYSAWPDGDKPELSAVTPLGGVDFSNLEDGADITGVVSHYGTFGNGYGMRGDTSIARSGKVSSASCSIQAGTTGRPGDGTPLTNGDFGFIQSLGDNDVIEGEEFWLYGWFYIPETFNFSTGGNGLKFLRYTYPSAGPELDTYLADGNEFNVGDVTANTGWHLVNESYPQVISNMHKQTKALFVKGRWNFICRYTKASVNQSQSIDRMWVNDEFAMGHEGGVSDVTTKWLDQDGVLQTATWTPAGAKWATLIDANPSIDTFYFGTYWNNNAPQDQQLNIERIQYVKSASGLSTDAYGNAYVNSEQV